MQDYSKMNPNDFSQKDLMLHLLQVAQHTVTREELKEDISDIKEYIAKVETRFDKVEARFDKVDEKISKVEIALKQDISKVEIGLRQDISKVEIALRQDISKVEIALKQDNKDLIKRVDRFMFWSLSLTITSTFLILGLIYKIIPQ